MSEDQRTFETDVLVVGGGMAGCFAAMAAKHSGNRVLLVEPSNVLGGQGTAGGVAGFCADTLKVNVLFDELVARLAKHDLIAPYNPNADRRAYDLEWCAFYLQEMVAERGIDVLLHATIVDVVAEGGRVTHAAITSAGEAVVVEPKVVIDATGRCVVPLAAGMPVEHLGANAQLPMSLYFTLWDTGGKVTPVLPPNCPTWDSDDELPMTTLHPFATGKCEVKMKVVGFDAADAESLSQAEMHARRQMHGLIYHLQTKGYRGRVLDTFTLASVSRHIGVREERRIVGEYVLTEHDVTHGCVFDDAVAVGTYHLDYHWPDKVERAGTGITTMVEPYHLPLRMLIPEGAKNVLVPGRSASGDQMAMSSYRVMGTVAQMGFAAGHAARMAVEAGVDLPDVDIESLQAALESQGQRLDLSQHGQYLRRAITTHEHVFDDDRPFAQCHASTLVHLANGRFLVAWFGGTKEKHDDVGIWAADRFEGTWSKPRLLAKVDDVPHWNPVLFRAPDGKVWLYFKVSREIINWVTWVMESDDDGQTWSPPRQMLPGDPLPRGPVKNKPIVLSDGTWLAPASTEERTADGDQRWNAAVDRSEDGGATWHWSVVPCDHESIAGAGVIQPTLWESQPGHVHMLMRSSMGKVCRSDSTDGGRTWSPVTPIGLPNNNSGLDLTRLDDGTLALVCNPVEGNWAARTPLSIMLSFDNGHTWPRRLDIETEPGEYSYPAIIPTPRGMAVSYTWRRERVAFWHGSIEQIPEIKAVSTNDASAEEPKPVVAPVPLRVDSETDVLVIGGGTAGPIAAIAAARCGAKTMLVEQGSQLGGTTTVGGVAFPGLFHAWGKQVIAGIGWEMVTRAVEIDGGTLPDFTVIPPRHFHHQVLVNPYLYSALLEEACVEAGARLCYYEFPQAVEDHGDHWRVTIAGPGTMHTVRCRQIVDCTGGADVVGMMGFDRLRGEERQPGSMLFRIGTQEPTELQGLSLLYVHGSDHSNSVTRTQANLAGRRDVLKRLREQHDKGNRAARLLRLQPEATCRETYRIVGDTLITHDDYVTGRVFDDAICHAFYPVDLHTRDGVVPKPLDHGVVPTVPLGALMPRGSDRVIVAGRSLSSDRLANSALRVQATCMATGQAAGTAAALAADHGGSPRNVPLERLRQTLVQHGAIVPAVGIA